MSNEILVLLAKSSAQKPVAFDSLVTESGLLPKTLNMILDSMYAKRLINQAKVTRKGIEQREVWLTGVVEKATRQHFVINKAYTPPSGHQMMPRREENPVIKPAEAPPALAAPREIKNEEVIQMNSENKPKALLMLNYIEQNEGCSINQLQDFFNDKTLGNSFIRTYISAGKVIVTKHNNKNYYAILEGLTVNDFYGNKAIKQKVTAESEGVSSGKRIADALADGSFYEKHQAEKLQFSDIEHPEQYVKPDMPVCEIAQTAEKRKFRVALTSDRTLLLFGIQSEPIELDIFETDKLIEFCDSVGLSLPMTVQMFGTDSHHVAGKQL